jgi:exopolysaccharide biosynthesis polyprenyl glycosylphosphotransferase
MLKENWRFIARLERLGDLAIIVVSFVFAYYGRSSLLFWDQVFGWELPFQGEKLAPIKDYFIVLVVALFGYMMTLHGLGAYGSMRLSSAIRLFGQAFFSSAVVFVLLAASLFIFKIDLSRSFILLFCALVACLLGLERYLVVSLLRYWRRRGRNFRNVILCGVGDQAVRMAREINARPELGLCIRGFADLRDPDIHRERSAEYFRRELSPKIRVGRIILGTEGLARALREYAIDEIVFTDIVEVMPQVEEMVLICAEQGVRTTIAADLFSLGLVKSGISYFGGMPLVHFQTPPGDGWELSVKRAIDVVVSAILILVLSPLFLAVALGVRSTPGPVIFRQTRVGLNGRLFQMFKFRSMYRGAEASLAELREQNEMTGPAFKMSGDPRVTPLGRFLRRFSLDELPQLWNVLRGDMSLVGPRPPVPGEVGMYERRSRRRLSMRPGLTCTWQVSGRNNIKDFDSWVALDLEYIDNWSLVRDMILIFRTIPAVLFGQGAR